MSVLFTPLAVLYLVILVGLVRLWWRHKEARRRVLWVAVPFLLLYLLSTDPVAHLTLGPLEWPYPPSGDVPPNAEAIVVLAGAVRQAGGGRPGVEPGPSTLYRCLHAAALHRKAPHLPVVVSGGADPDGGPAYAEVMRDFLAGQGVKPSVVIVEGRSRNTYENAVESCRLLRERGVRRVLLVTDASHMWRAAACFRKQGVEVIPSACNHLELRDGMTLRDVVPDAESVSTVDTAFHELIGMLVYRLRGRV